MKRNFILSIIAALVVCVGVLTSCGDDVPEIKSNRLTKSGKTVDLPYAGIFIGDWGCSIFLTDDATVSLVEEVGTETNPCPANFVTIDIPNDYLGEWVKSTKAMSSETDFYFGASVDGKFTWFVEPPVLTKFECYVDYKEGVLTVDISATNDNSKLSTLKSSSEETAKVTFKGKPEVSDFYLFYGM